MSKGLNTLENELGFKIFDRKNIPVTFTPEGDIYFDYIKRLQLLTDDMERRIHNYHDDLNGKVSIGGPVAYIESLVTSAISRLREENPSYNFTIKGGSLAELIEMANDGEVDCFVSTSEDIPDNFEKKLITKEKVYLCIPKNNPINLKISEFEIKGEKGGGYFDYSILDGEEFIFLEKELPLQMQVEVFFEKYGINPINKVVVNQVSTAVNMAIKEQGICFASESALEGNIDLSNVSIYALENIISGRNIYVAYHKDLFLPKACYKLIDQLVNNK